jgi:hypothetical protein
MVARNKAVCLALDVSGHGKEVLRGYTMTISDTSYKSLEHVLQKYHARSLVLLLCRSAL